MHCIRTVVQTCDFAPALPNEGPGYGGGGYGGAPGGYGGGGASYGRGSTMERSGMGCSS